MTHRGAGLWSRRGEESPEEPEALDKTLPAAVRGSRLLPTDRAADL
jgi:hypothetical protein